MGQDTRVLHSNGACVSKIATFDGFQRGDRTSPGKLKFRY